MGTFCLLPSTSETMDSLDSSWSLNNADLLQQVGTLMWANSTDGKAPEFVTKLAATRIGYELYERISGERELEALRNETYMGIAKYIKDHPKATKEELTKEISKHIWNFKQKVEKL